MQDKEHISPLGATLTAAGIAGSLFAALGLSAGAIAVAGVAVIGTAVWFLAKNKTINPVIESNGLTPEGEPFACGVENQQQIIQKSKTR